MIHSYGKLASYAGYCILAMLIFGAGNASAQLNTNGSFESSPVGVVDTTGWMPNGSYAVKGWFIQVASAVTALPSYEIVSDTVERGNRALKVTLGGSFGANEWDIQIVADSIPVTPGKTYRYTVWAKASQAGCMTNFTIGRYSFNEYARIHHATIGTQWQQYATTFTISDTERVIRAPIHFGFAVDTSASIWIDDLRILESTAGMKPIVIEAESGVAGSMYPTLTDAGVTYVSPAGDLLASLCPYDTNRVITFQVTFTDSGHYNLFSRVRVGANGFNDDSYFYGNGWGVKDVKDSLGGWIRVNGLASAGYTDPMATVDAAGGAGTQVWKWVNHKNGFSEATGGIPFWVPLDSLTQTFQIGARENGLDIDKLAFGRSNLFFTVTNLDSVQVGSGALDTNAVWQGPALAHDQGKFLGCTYNGPDANFTKYWNQVTPGNAGKFGSVGVSADTAAWSWSTLNAAYVLAKSNSLPFKDHCLIWGNQQPSWISSLDSASKVAILEQWIRQVGIRFPNTDMVDVVNEPLHNPPDGNSGHANYMAALGGSGTTGWDWVIWAFTKAREYMPNAKLILNEYSIINSDASTTSYLEIINLLKDRNLIDGIGVQGHRFELETADTTVMKNNLDRLAATGIPIYISEFDLGNVGNTGTPNDQAQLNLYKKIFPILWLHPGIKGITIWDYIEGQTWQTTCYLVRSTGSYRPALAWMAQFITDNPVGVERTYTQLPLKYGLDQNYPNPFNPTTNIRYSITKTSPVTLKIFDILGRQVETLVNTVQSPGQYTVTFSAKNLASGIYFYQLHAGNFTETKKLMLLK